MVFMSGELGEHSITTRDIDVNENTVVQFEVGLSAMDVGIYELWKVMSLATVWFLF